MHFACMWLVTSNSVAAHLMIEARALLRLPAMTKGKIIGKYEMVRLKRY